MRIFAASFHIWDKNTSFPILEWVSQESEILWLTLFNKSANLLPIIDYLQF